MKNRIKFRNKDTQTQYDKMNAAAERLDELVTDMLCRLYREKIECMDDEELGYEFADKIGDALREFDSLMFRKGREFVEHYLLDNFYYEIEKGKLNE